MIWLGSILIADAFVHTLYTSMYIEIQTESEDLWRYMVKTV